MTKLEFLILFVAVSVVSANIPNDEYVQHLKVQQIVHKALLTQNIERAESAKDNFKTGRFLLPNNTIPLHYDISLSTEIHSGNFEFEGVVRIDIRVLEESNTITIHSRQHVILGIVLFNPDGSEFDTAAIHTFDAEVEFLTILTSQIQFTVDQELTVEITYTGTLSASESDHGWFRSFYIEPATNQSVWMATTHFHPIVNTRHAFPCYDEAQYRMTVKLQIRHHESYHAISSMPVESMDPIDGSDYIISIFETTPPIQIFGLSFTVSNLRFVSTIDDGLEFRVFARPEAIAAGEADNALELGVTMLRATENYFNIDNALTKSDQIAHPRFEFSSAADWGILSVAERILLRSNDDMDLQLNRERVIAHLYSHNLFGNLVAPVSWTYLWMNEGFATLYENVLNDIVFPEKNLWGTFLIEFFDVSMELDVFDFVDPLNLPVESPQDIIQKYWGFGSYFKAALVLRMFQEAFTEATWLKGVTYYLLEMQYKLVTPEDLFIGLQRAIDEDFPGSTVSVGSLMHTWLNFAGFPVLTVSRNGSNLIVTQQGFRTMHDEVFSIPLNYATASEPNFNDTGVFLYLVTPQGIITQDNAPRPWTDDDWIIFNLRDTGYYVTNYDESLWLLIIDALNNDHEAIHFLNRGTLFADLHRLLSENWDVRATLFLDLMGSLPFETHPENSPHVWRRANAGLTKFEERLRGSRLHRMFMNYVHSLMTSVYNVVATTFTDRRATNVVNSWSCLSELIHGVVENCLTDSLNALVEEMESGSSSFEFDYRCNGFMTANATVWMHFFNQAMAMSGFDPNRLGNLLELMCTQDRELLRFLLEETVNFSNILFRDERVAIISGAATMHEASFDVALEFIEENHQAIEQMWSVSDLLRPFASVTNTECQAERVLYLTRFIPVDINPGRNFFRNIMIPNLNFYAGNLDFFHDWFDNFALNNSTA